MSPLLVTIALALSAPKPGAKVAPEPSPNQVAAPTATSGGAAAEAEAAVRQAAPATAQARLRLVLLRVGEPLVLPQAEQLALDEVIAALQAGKPKAAHAAWKALVRAHHARTNASDVDDLIAAVLYAVHLQANAELHDALASLVANNVARKQLREHVKALRGQLEARPPKAPGLSVATVVVSVAPGKVPEVIAGPTKQLGLAELDAYVTDVQGKLDGLAELGEEQQLRVQEQVAKQQKLAQALSNLLKKFSQTADTIIANMK